MFVYWQFIVKCLNKHVSIRLPYVVYGGLNMRKYRFIMQYYYTNTKTYIEKSNCVMHVTGYQHYGIY